MNRSKREAFERMAKRYPDDIPLRVLYYDAPGMATLWGSRRSHGWIADTGRLMYVPSKESTS